MPAFLRICFRRLRTPMNGSSGWMRGSPKSKGPIRASFGNVGPLRAAPTGQELPLLDRSLQPSRGQIPALGRPRDAKSFGPGTTLSRAMS